MFSKAANPSLRSAAWRISLWATLAFAIGTMLVFVMLHRFVAHDIQRRSDAWLAGEVEVLGDVAERLQRTAFTAGWWARLPSWQAGKSRTGSVPSETKTTRFSSCRRQTTGRLSSGWVLGMNCHPAGDPVHQGHRRRALRPPGQRFQCSVPLESLQCEPRTAAISILVSRREMN